MWTSLVNTGRALRRGLLQLVYPNSCWLCGQPLPEADRSFCHTCRGELTRDRAPTCPHCASSVGPFVPVSDGCPRCRGQEFAFDRAFRLGLYDGLLRDVVLRLKHWSGEGLGEAVGRLWAEHCSDRLRAADIDVVIPIPLHWRKRYRRGYNQSEVLARCLAASLTVACHPRWLRRIRSTTQQTQLLPTQRRENVHNAFQAARGASLAGKHVLLVDDVMTTGATASEAARALRRARPRRITLAVLAHDRRENR